MPWNEPGDPSKNKDPWTGRSKQTPPDLEAFLRDLLKKITTFFKLRVFNTQSTRSRLWAPTKIKGKPIALILFFCLLIWFAFGFFKVNPGESAVITNFSAYHSTESLGYHWLLKPFQQYTLVNSTTVNKLTTTLKLLTHDGNEVAVDIDMDYSIVNPRNYLFGNAHPALALQTILHDAAYRLLSPYTLDQLLNISNFSLAHNLQEQLDKLMVKTQTGLTIKAVTFGSIQIPEPLQASFSDTRHAQQDKEQVEKLAHIYALQMEPRAKANAQKLIAEAKTYQQEALLKAKTDITHFLALVPAYEASPLLTSKRLYLAGLHNMMTNSTKFVVTNNPPTHFSLTLEKSNTLSNQTDLTRVADNNNKHKNTDPNKLINNRSNTISSNYTVSGGYE